MSKNETTYMLLAALVAFYVLKTKSAPAPFVGPIDPDDVCNANSANYNIAACYSAGRTPYTG